MKPENRQTRQCRAHGPEGDRSMRHTKYRLSRWLTAALAALLALLTAIPSQADETIAYIHWDALGSPVAATDEAGNVVWRESYRPYGQRIDNEPAADANSRWYTGHPQDADTGLVYAGARYYDPVVGRFLAQDPVEFQEDNLHSFNRYAYGANNPYKYIDPDGRVNVCASAAVAATRSSATCGGGFAGGGSLGGAPRVSLPSGSTGAPRGAPVGSGTLGAGKGPHGGGKPDFVVSRDGAVVPNSPKTARQSLEKAGSRGKKISNPSGTETGSVHNIPDMKMDVRIMDGGPVHPPRVVTTRQGTRQPVNPSDGSNFGNVPRAEQRARSHIPFIQ